MTYVMSDLHGEFGKYRAMLELIKFKESDTLIINGDICDRGDESAKIYLDVMGRDNVFVIKGNHEVMAQSAFESIIRECWKSGDGALQIKAGDEVDLWFDNGGEKTLNSMFCESWEDVMSIIRFIKDLPYYKTLEVRGKRYVILHGGISIAQRGVPIEKLDPCDLVWTRPAFDSKYFDDGDTYLVVGHTPTLMLRRTGEPATVYYGKGDVIAIDCGAAYSEYLGRLGCLCLDTGEEFYV